MPRFCFTLVIAAVCLMPLLSTAEEKRKRLPTHIREDFATINEAIDRAEELLRTEDYKHWGAIVCRIRTADGRPIEGKRQLHNIGRTAGYTPGRFETDKIYLTMKRTIQNKRALELRLIAPDYQQLQRKTILTAGEIKVWDDLVLEPLTKATSATINGSVWLEDSDDLEDIVLFVNGSPVGFTDRRGYFEIENVSAGEIRVSARKSGYKNLYKSVEVEPGQSLEVELDGYLPRYAHVWWEYQPDESRSFTTGVHSGSAVLDSRELRRVMFDKALRDVGGKSDFMIRQDADKLLIGHFDVRGPGIPGHIHFDDRTIEQISEAPERGYGRKWRELKKGDVYVFKTYDGKHYAKLEVLEVTTKDPED